MGNVNTQDYNTYVLRSPAILTNSYVAGTVLGPTQLLDANNQIVLYIAFTLGSLTDLRIKFEFSNDNTTFYQECFGLISGSTETDSLGEHVITASGNYRIPVQMKDRYLKVSFKGTGTLTSSSVGAISVIGIA